MKRTMKLPDKPSELLLLALADLEAVERDPRYRVNMATWLERVDGVCYVCFAGAVMAQTCGVGDSITPRDGDIEDVFGKKVGRKLRALDYFRLGWVDEALDMFGIDQFRVGDDYYTSPRGYREDPEGFKQDMASLAGILQAEGL